ncbi:MAG TPA: hypothetical protein VFE05_13580 [Longimicrobiaceae bacterium]|jgi:hypothetical protein|nr:hypothetical protein [Longimicrobiaceae bacterium]
MINSRQLRHLPFARGVRAAISLSLTLAAGGCAMAPKFVGTTSLAGSPPVSVPSVYVYSFLDLRAADLGPRMIGGVEQQLASALRSHGVESEQHRFSEDPISAEFARVHGTERIPVREVIARNAADEGRFAAPYRLIIFPMQTTQSGSWYYYDFRWTLQDAKTQRVVWSTTSRGRHLNWMRSDENSTKRAQVIVDGVIGEMVSSGLLK